MASDWPLAKGKRREKKKRERRKLIEKGEILFKNDFFFVYVRNVGWAGSHRQFSI